MEQKEEKKKQVRSMFNTIAHRYDLLNHLLSAGIDYNWRKKVISSIGKARPKNILDVATGTGDLAIAAAKLRPDKITGIDIAEEMLVIGRKKIIKKKLDHIVTLETGDSENLQYNDNYFDAVMVAFGVRNFENLDQGLKEMYRVLNTGGILAVLEFSKPRKFPVKQLYFFYFRYLLPFIGRVVSGNQFAYTYLPDSVGNFPDGQDFISHLDEAGFINNSNTPLTFGIATLYIGYKQ